MTLFVVIVLCIYLLKLQQFFSQLQISFICHNCGYFSQCDYIFHLENLCLTIATLCNLISKLHFIIIVTISNNLTIPQGYNTSQFVSHYFNLISSKCDLYISQCDSIYHTCDYFNCNFIYGNFYLISHMLICICHICSFMSHSVHFYSHYCDFLFHN